MQKQRPLQTQQHGKRLSDALKHATYMCSSVMMRLKRPYDGPWNEKYRMDATAQ
jgi:hypothetical protein